MKKNICLYLFLGIFTSSFCIPYIQAKSVNDAMEIAIGGEEQNENSKKEGKSFQISEEYCLHENTLSHSPNQLNSNCHNRSQIGKCTHSASEVFSPPEA